MKLNGLHLTEFRNIERQAIRLLPRLNFFLGENGQGKTNLVEAVFLLCRGTSFRASDATTLTRNQSQRCRVTGLFENHSLDYRVETTIENGRKATTVNGKRATAASLMSQLPLVLFSPESLSVIKDGPEQRRNLIDEILVSHDPKQARLISEFTRALKARNRLLRNLAEGLGSQRDQVMSLDSLNKIYFVLATHLTVARLNALKSIQPFFVEAMHSILDESMRDIAVEYLISEQSALSWNDSQIFDALRKRHQDLASREMASGTSLVGPHKHDIQLLFAGNDSRFYCSQGQQRALILALKIAQIVYHHRVHQTYPILLLDDVMSELDAKKRVNLMKFLEGISAQILITATDLTWSDQFALDRNSVFQVLDGKFTAGSNPP